MIRLPWNRIADYLRNPKQSNLNKLEGWLSAAEENRCILHDLKSISAITGFVSTPFKASKVQSWSRIIARIGPQEAVTGSRWWLYVAASLLLLVTGGGFSLLLFHSSEAQGFTEVYSPEGSKTRVVLPDHSVVWLNGGSSIAYSADFKKSRSVTLRGEGFFDVVPDRERLFTVLAGRLKLEVYGTTFDFRAYPDEHESEVVLVSGSLGLFCNGRPVSRLAPGEAANINLATNRIALKRGNVDLVTAWMGSKLVIKDKSVEETARILERRYRVRIEVERSLENSSLLNFNITDESLIEVLSAMNRVVPIEYEVNGKEVKIRRIRKK